jgi:hypothetical protein
MQTAEQLQPEMTPAERRQFLIDNADHIEDGLYYRYLTQEDKDAKSAQVSANVMQIWELEEEAAKIAKEYRDRLKPIKEDTRELAYEVKTGQEEHNGPQYHIRNFDTGFVDIFDESGLLITSRRLMPNEKQKKMKMI